MSYSMNQYEWSLLSRLRTGSLPLEVETGRYNNVPLENRLRKQCQVCVEDEIHFTVDCPFYDDLRYTSFILLRDVYSGFDDRPSIIKYILIMQSKQFKQIGSIIVKMYDRRKSHLS